MAFDERCSLVLTFGRNLFVNKPRIKRIGSRPRTRFANPAVTIARSLSNTADVM
jgi:hypothetical protein